MLTRICENPYPELIIDGVQLLLHELLDLHLVQQWKDPVFQLITETFKIIKAGLQAAQLIFVSSGCISYLNWESKFWQFFIEKAPTSDISDLEYVYTFPN